MTSENLPHAATPGHDGSISNPADGLSPSSLYQPREIASRLKDGRRPRTRMYLRYASPEGGERSELRQMRAGEAYAMSSGMEIERWYSDRATSGLKMSNRKALEQMLADAVSGEFDVLIVEDLDRLSRNLCDSQRIVDTLRRAGVEVHLSASGEIRRFIMPIIAGRRRRRARR